jgi:hypothetical protein
MLEEFVFPFVNATAFVITTFDLWMSKGAMIHLPLSLIS